MFCARPYACPSPFRLFGRTQKPFTAPVQAARLAQESLTVSASPSTVATVSTPSLQDLVQEQRKAIDDLIRQLKCLQTSPPVVAATSAPNVTWQLTLRAQDWSRLRIQSLLYRSQGPLGKDYFRTTIFFPANFVTLLAVYLIGW